MNLYSAVLLTCLILRCMALPMQSKPQATPPNANDLHNQAMVALKLVDQFETDSEKNGKTDKPSDAEKDARLAVSMLPDTVLCNVPIPPRFQKLTPEPERPSCAPLRNSLEMLIDDAERIADATFQFQVTHRDNFKKDLEKLIRDYRNDRTWVLVVIEKIKDSKSQPR